MCAYIPSDVYCVIDNWQNIIDIINTSNALVFGMCALVVIFVLIKK